MPQKDRSVLMSERTRLALEPWTPNPRYETPILERPPRHRRLVFWDLREREGEGGTPPFRNITESVVYLKASNT